MSTSRASKPWLSPAPAVFLAAIPLLVGGYVSLMDAHWDVPLSAKWTLTTCPQW